MTEKRSRALNFDRLVRVYRWMEWLTFGPYLWRCRCAFLPEMMDARRALVLGDGDGRFTAELLRRNRQISVTAVDISRGMLESLQRRAGADSGRVRIQAQDARTWGPPAGTEYDLVVTHFFLDCLATDDVKALAGRVRPSVAPRGRWVVSEFAVPAGWFGRYVARPVVAVLYRSFQVMTGLGVSRLPDWPEALHSAGFRQVREQPRLCGLLTGQVWRAAGSGDEPA
jgi:SAM-dependent methyltransferase